MKKKIFVSSTYTDLIPHRAEVLRVLQGFNVDILGMEYFGARKSPPLETCLTEVEQCDIYVGVIGLRYGSVHSKHRKSFTQIEYEKAIALGKDARLFLLDEHDGEIKTGFIDTGTKLSKQLKFREYLKDNHTVEFYTNEKDLGIKIFKAFKDSLPVFTPDIKRPEKLECRVFRYQLGNSNWICFVGYLSGKPFEIHNALADDEEGVLIPRSVTNGTLVEVKEENNQTRIDFSYANKYGYRITIERISFVFNPQTSKYDKIISKLLRNNVQLSVIIETLHEMTVLHNDDMREWNLRVMECLNN